MQPRRKTVDPGSLQSGNKLEIKDASCDRRKSSSSLKSTGDSNHNVSKSSEKQGKQKQSNVIAGFGTKASPAPMHTLKRRQSIVLDSSSDEDDLAEPGTGSTSTPNSNKPSQIDKKPPKSTKKSKSPSNSSSSNKGKTSKSKMIQQYVENAKRISQPAQIQGAAESNSEEEVTNNLTRGKECKCMRAYLKWIF